MESPEKSPLTSYSNGFENQQTITEAIKKNIDQIVWVPGIDPFRLMLAISGQETGFGSNNRPRYERAYDQEGLYGMRSKYLQSLLKKYGAIAACSYGPWQILYSTAFEHGFEGHPLELWSAEGSIPYVISYLNASARNGASSVEEFADAWNSGSFKDDNRPFQYMQNVRKIFDSLPEIHM